MPRTISTPCWQNTERRQTSVRRLVSSPTLMSLLEVGTVPTNRRLSETTPTTSQASRVSRRVLIGRAFRTWTTCSTLATTIFDFVFCFVWRFCFVR